ncbi:MAG TPA: universal stress protein, partial [Actinomycetota bacterium]
RPVGLPGIDERDEEAIEAATGHADTLAARLEGAGFTVDTAVERGRPGAELLDLARSREADLVVFGSHGTGRLESVVLGSVSSQLVRSARATLVGR